MNILLINHYAGSVYHGMAFRPYYMANEWIISGHNVTIIASSESHLRNNSIKMSKSFKFEKIDNINYVWCRTTKYQENGIKRFINMLSFIYRLFQFTVIFLHKNKPDVIITSSTYPLDIFPAKLMSYFFKSKLIFEVHDLWPLSPMELGKMSRLHPFILLMQLAEDCSYRWADNIVSMLPNALEHMLSRGMSKDKFHYIPNGIIVSEWDNVEKKIEFNANEKRLLDLIIKDRQEGYFSLVYLGTHGVANALDTYIDVAKKICDEKVMFYLIGVGPEKSRLMLRCNDERILNVKFSDPIRKKSIPLILPHFDTCYIGLQKQPLFRFGIAPNKLMDYMASGRPIICAIEAGNDPVSDSGCGITIEPENVSELYRAINTMRKYSPEERLIMGKKGKQFVVDNHDYSVLAKKFIDVMLK